MKPRLYMETTIPSYLVAAPSRDLVVAAHQLVTREWWENERQNFDIHVSQFVLDEAGAGDPNLAKQRIEIISRLPKLELNEDAKLLASALINAKVIPAKAVIDAAHVAIAAVHGMNFLMTWNCAHIANAIMSQSIQDVCNSNGFSCPIICTPEELMGG